MTPRSSIPIVRRETMVESTAHALIKYIATNRLKPGTMLPSERELVEMTGVSRLPLREALSILKGLGIVEARHGKGIFIKPLNMAAIFGMLSPLLKVQADINPRQIEQIRWHLEGAGAELAAVHRTEENLQQMAAAVEGMRLSLLDRQAYITHDIAFHQELAKSTGNPIFFVLTASISDLSREIQHLYQDKVEYREAAIREHSQILEAVSKRDGVHARTAMQKHISNAEKRL